MQKKRDFSQTKVEIGKRVREARLAAGLTQVQLAERAGMAQPSLSDLEIGKGAALETLYDLARALKVHPSIFLP